MNPAHQKLIDDILELHKTQPNEITKLMHVLVSLDSKLTQLESIALRMKKVITETLKK